MSATMKQSKAPASSTGARPAHVEGCSDAAREANLVVVKANPQAAFGISFGTGGVVRQVQPGGQAAASGVRVGWCLTEILHTGGGHRQRGRDASPEPKSAFSTSAVSTQKEILAAIAAARKRGRPYTLTFCRAADGHSSSDGSVHAPSLSRSADGCGVTAAQNATPKAAVAREEAVGVSPEPTESRSRGCAQDLDTKLEGGGDERAPIDGPGNGDANEAVTGEKTGPAVPAAEAGRVAVAGAEVRGDARVATHGAGAGDLKADGEVTLMYEMYDEKFAIKNGIITAADIDDVYCLSFAMPNCILHLGHLCPADRYAREDGGEAVPYVREDPPGTFHGLVAGGVYWVYVSRDEEEERKDAQRMKQVLQGMRDDAAEGDEARGSRKDDGRNGLESCSCVYGNPCVDEYGCKDWNSRYAIAKANGWKGF